MATTSSDSRPLSLMPDHPSAGAGRGKVNDHAKIRGNPKAERTAAVSDHKEYEGRLSEAAMFDRESLPSENEISAGRRASLERVRNAERAAGGREPGHPEMRTASGYKNGGLVKVGKAYTPYTIKR